MGNSKVTENHEENYWLFVARPENYDFLHSATKSKKPIPWTCGKETKVSEKAFMYCMESDDERISMSIVCKAKVRKLLKPSKKWSQTKQKYVDVYWCHIEIERIYKNPLHKHDFPERLSLQGKTGRIGKDKTKKLLNLLEKRKTKQSQNRKTPAFTEAIEGTKEYQKRAREAMPILVRQAHAKKTITYKDLAEELGMPNERNLNYPLDSIGQSLIKIGKKWKRKIPAIQALVINKNTGIPGKGISGSISDVEYKNVSKRQQREITNTLHANIYSFERWNDVLKEFKVKPSTTDSLDELSKKAASRSYGGGEGKAHRKLKEFIKLHPEAIGLKKRPSKAETEHKLPSGDSLDVFFQFNTDEIAVEVKATKSDIPDITRGMYQCVKYLAVLEARQAALSKPQNARSILVLESKLPKKLVPLKNILRIEVKQDIKPSN